MTTTIEAGAARPPGTAARRLLLLLVALLLALTPALGAAQPAHAGSHGTGYDIGLGFLGAYRADDGRQAYCVDLGLNIPFSPTSGPTTVTSLDSISRPQLAQLNYVLAKWGQSGDPNVTAAVALFVWSLADPGVYNSHGQSGDSYYVARAPSGARPTILANLATMRSEAANNAVTDPTLSLSISMADQYQGTLTVAATPAHLQGPALLSLALFSDGSTSRTLGAGQYGITGTPAEGAPVAGAVPYGATLVIEAYRQHAEEPTCTEDELVFTSQPIAMRGSATVAHPRSGARGSASGGSRRASSQAATSLTANLIRRPKRYARGPGICRIRPDRTGQGSSCQIPLRWDRDGAVQISPTKKSRKPRVSGTFFVAGTGFEPVTSGL